MDALTVFPAMPLLTTRDEPHTLWSGARWIGSLDTGTIEGHTEISPAACDGFSRARLLIREAGAVRGYADVGIRDGRLDRTELLEEIKALPPAEHRHDEADGPLPPVTVVVCTKDRAEQLRVALASLLKVDYPDFTVIVVDNASTTSATRDLVQDEFDDPRLFLVTEATPGLARARNTGLQQATGDFVAFTDDDVVVDAAWLREIVSAFRAGNDVACVTGLVPTGELTTPVHEYFDERVSWSKNLRTRSFTLADPPADLPLFPFSVGAFGTGANFALRRSAAIALGGFDTAFGVGTRTGGGEDLDIFTRVILAGHTLTMQPSAIVWHRHRGDMAALRAQARGYGTGLGAWLTKILLNPHTAWAALRRAVPAVARLAASLSRPPSADAIHDADSPDLDEEFTKVRRLELLCLARGPLAYAHERWRGAGEIGRDRAVEKATRLTATPISFFRGPVVPADAGTHSAPRARRESRPARRPTQARSAPTPGLACIVLAHTDPIQVRRLVSALDPFPVFLHIDVRTSESTYRSMIHALPERCVPLRRMRTGWARWENVAAEIEGYRAALALTDASHFMLMSGSDYPLAPASELRELLAKNLGSSFALFEALPHPRWGQNHGFSRLRYRHWAMGKHMLRLPIPRRMPQEVVFAGGSQMKILAREHARAVVDVYDQNPELVRFWRRSWIPDETFVASVVSTPGFVPDWEEHHVPAPLWWIDWGEGQHKSPLWLGAAHTSRVLTRRMYDGQKIPSMVARKFSTATSTPLLTAIDRELLHGRPTLFLAEAGRA
jgi:GT2 family glycosyltransferase